MPPLLELPAFKRMYTILSFDIIVLLDILYELSRLISNKTNASALLPSYIYKGTIENEIV